MSKLIKQIEDLVLMDDILMNVVLGNDPEATGEVLKAILGKPGLRVIDVKPQVVSDILGHRGARFDIVAEDEDGTRYDIEVQRSSDGAIPKRVRFNQIMMDKDVLEPGSKWEDLPQTFIIFITENDVLGGNKPIYHIHRTIDELDNKPFDDGEMCIYVNCGYTGNDGSEELRNLIHDFNCKDSNQINNPVLAERIRYYKNEEGRSYMSETIQRWYKEELENSYSEGRVEGRVEGRSLERKATALALFSMGLDKNAIKKALRTDSEEEINIYYEEWLKTQS